MDPQSRAVLDGINASGMLPFRQFTPQEVRQRVLALRATTSPATPADDLDVFEESIPGPAGPFRARIIRPIHGAGGSTLPIVLYFHGGGFLFGSLDESDAATRRIACGVGAVVVNVEYHLAPEAKFPVAVEEAYAALCWVSENARRIGGDPDRIAIAGDSAGGNLTIVTCIAARDGKGPPIRFQVPIYPSLDLHSRPHYSSRLKWGGGGYVLDHEDIDWMLGHYLNDPAEGDDWRASPLMVETFAGLPPALIVTADHDPLCDEAKLYADRLDADGVEVEYACFAGTFHGFVGYAGVLDVGARGLDLICDRIRRAMTQDVAAIPIERTA